MKKVININFQGRVIPIEETAFELLKQYIESLRRYFAREEGRDEIINDIESRIAELFSERLKKGSTCITDEDVNAVIASMGRPEDFEADAAAGGPEETTGTSQQQTHYQQSQSAHTYAATPGRGRLYRNDDDKILGGVASGLANYFGIDPVVMRILFVVLVAPLFWVYILLWIIIPSKSIQTNITKRLYRSADDRVISGVCGGLAQYFHIDTWIPRLIFALPLIVAIVSGPFNFFWNDWGFWHGPKIITGSLSSTLFLTYIILWIALPVAVTAAEKLEMRGERVDLNSIRNTVKEDLESFKTKAEKWGSEVKQSAQQFGEKAKEFGQTASSQAKTFSAEAAPMAHSASRGIGHILGVLFKAFFLLIAGTIALVLFGLLIGLLFGGFAVFPLKNFILDGFWQNVLAWTTLLLFLGIPLVALITWLIRRIAGVRSKNRYLGYVFGSLWTIGLVSAILLMGFVSRDFKTRSAVEESSSIIQPRDGKLYVDVSSTTPGYYGSDWFGIDSEDWPFYAVNPDTVMLNTIRIDVKKSNDTAFHVSKIKFSRGNTPAVAKSLAERIRFDVSQQNGALMLPKGFAISRDEKFRNQQVLVVIEVPVGKRIELDRSISEFEWFDVRFNRRGGFNFDFDEDWGKSYWLQTGKEYIMTENDGPKRLDQLDQKELKKGRIKLKIRDGEMDVDVQGEFNDDSQSQVDTTTVDRTKDYRYRKNNNKTDNNDNNKKKKDTVAGTKEI